jgi:hypothetical protein
MTASKNVNFKIIGFIIVYLFNYLFIIIIISNTQITSKCAVIAGACALWGMTRNDGIFVVSGSNADNHYLYFIFFVNCSVRIDRYEL